MAVDLAVVPVAGRGTRLLPLTKSQPKEMLPVGQKPVVQYVAEELANSGVRRLLFITGPGKTAIENHFDINEELTTMLREHGQETLLATLAYEREQVDYFYTRQRRQLGLGHAVLCAKPMVAEQSFVVALGDSIIERPSASEPGRSTQSDIVRRLIDVFERTGADAVIAFEEVPEDDVIHYGIAKPATQFDDHFELADLVEKPSRESAPSRMAVAGRYVFRSKILDYLEAAGHDGRSEIDLTDSISRLARDGGKVLGVQLVPGERRFDIGHFASYFRAFAEFALNDPEHGPALRAHLAALLARRPE
jgi:UTP--glucose-1-phosphate uridylyltransferase